MHYDTTHDYTRVWLLEWDATGALRAGRCLHVPPSIGDALLYVLCRVAPWWPQ